MGDTYTRQSSYTDGDVITAAHTNNEFNQLLAAFAASTGHTHDGTAAEGGPITKLLGNALTFGAGTAGTDITITFDGETSDGELKWMEDEDYFEFSDDILIASTEKLQFRDTAIYINSSTDGQLDLVADSEIQIAATTIDINGNVDISGTLTIGSAGISEAELEILDGATVTTTELNILDGDTSATSTTVADADRVVFNDAGTMKQVAVTDLAAYFDDEITAMPNLVTTGALNSGSITSGFGTIDTGSSTITTTGLITGGSLDIDDVVINGSTIGHTDDTDLITVANGIATVAGEISVTTLDIGGTNVTSTAAELNILDGVTATAAELNYSDTGAAVGTVVASKVVTVDSNKDVASFRNITLTGELDAGSLDVSGDADIDGTLEADAITVNGTALNTVIAGVTVTDATNSAHVLVTDNESTNEENLITFVEDATSSTGNVGLEMDGNLTYNPSTGTITATIFKGNIDAVDGDFDGTLEADAITLNGTAITATATLDTGISNNNVPKFTSGVADNDFLRVDGTAIEGRSASEVLSDISAAPAAGSSNIVTTGALNSGSITSGFGAINNGASAITTTGVITGGTLEATADTSAGDNAAIGYTSAEGLILTGQGSTSDITLKNDADATVFTVPTGTDDILFPDNAKAMFGAGSDLQIYHDGSNSYVKDAGTGDLLVQGTQIKLQDASGNDYLRGFTGGSVYLHHAGNTKFETTSTGVAVTGNATFADNGKAIFGAGSDLAIYHSGTNSIIEETSGAGSLIIKGTNISFEDGTGAETYATFIKDGAATIRYDNAIKLTTLSNGAQVTGTFYADGVVVGDSEKIQLGASQDFQLYHDGSNSFIDDAGTGNIYLRGSSQVIIGNMTGEQAAVFNDNGAVTLNYDNAQKLATTATGVDITGDTAITGHASIGVDAIASTRALTVAGATDGSGSSILVCYNSSLSPKFSVRDDGLVSAAGSVDITGNIDFSGGILASNGSVQFVMDKDNNGGEVFVWGHNAANATTNELMRLNASGSLGIGTSSPIAQSKLTVAGGGGSISVTGADGNFGAGGQRTFMDFTSGKSRIGGTGGGAAGTTLGLYVGTGLEAVNIAADGKVGIGRTPSHVLDILCGNSTALQAIRIADTSPTEYFGVFNANEGGQTPNAANATLKVRGMNTTSRAINAGGTVNASGADYAEYMTKADGCGTIAKGAVCGVDADGKLTDVFANAHSFVIKSTDPSYVGGDVWSIASTDADGNQTTLEGDALEAARQTVDRIAFSGQVPCTITGTTKVGDFVIAQAKSDGGIEAVAVTSPTFEQYSVAIGKVWKLGSSQHTVAVKIG